MSREEAIDVLKHNYPSACFTDLCEAVEIAIQALSEQPEIVRCKDCGRYERDFEPDGDKPCGTCLYHLSFAYDTDYCSWAERRD